MSLSRVNMNCDVFMVCLQHALSTEQEEVMGLLIGEIDEKKIAHVMAVVMLRRSDKRKDRVEISPEQLTNATSQAEKISKELGQPMRVLGWYHSHPHITVWPSHVDVNTQASYQMLDEGFVGVIVSVFTEDKTTKEQQINITCFQSVIRGSMGEGEHFIHLEVPLYLEPTEKISRPCLQSMIGLPNILFEEEIDSFDLTKRFTANNILAQLNNKCVLTKSLCHITEIVSGPLVEALEQRKAANNKLCQELNEELSSLLKQHNS